MRVTDVMTTPVQTIAGTAEATAAREQMRLHGIKHLVVTEDNRPTGVLSLSDLGGPHGEAVRAGRRVDDLVIDKPVFVTPQTTVREAANLMRGHAVSCLAVIDRGKLRGIVTTFDLLELLGRGVDRPAVRGKRVILKSRGRLPRALAVAKRSSSSVPHTP